MEIAPVDAGVVENLDTELLIKTSAFHYVCRLQMDSVDHLEGTTRN